MRKVKSFISEHTAEYTLIPRMKKILHKRFDTVTPIYPWVTREWSKISEDLHKYDRFRVVGLYSRRPKLGSAGSQIITIKINSQILLGALSGIKLGIPIIAGCPLVTNFWELGNDPNCLWIKLDQASKEDFNIEFNIEREYEQSSDNINQISRSIIMNEEDLLTYLSEKSELMDFNSVKFAIREIKMESQEMSSTNFFGSVGGYKPIYFLLK